MAWIELTLARVKSPTVVNTDHIVRYGPQKRGDEITGTYVVTTAPAGDKGSHFIEVEEMPDQIERMLELGGVPVRRAAP